MITLNLTEERLVKINCQEKLLNLSVYNLSDEKIAKDNDFFKCSHCKNYFDQISEFTQYHYLYAKYEGKQFCNRCFDIVNKS